MFNKYMALILILAIPLFAFMPSGTSGFGWEKPDYVDYPPTQQSIFALEELISETGVIWQGRWNPQNGLPHRLMSNGYSFPVDDSADVIRRVYSFIESHPSLYGQIESNQLIPLSVKKKLGIWYITFKQVYQDIDVENARADFRIKNNKLVFIGVDLIPDIEPSTPAISADRAIELVSQRFDAEIQSANLVWFGPANGKLAWKIIAESQNPRHRWICHIDALEGILLAFYDDIRLDVSGQVQGRIHPMYGTDSTELRPLKYLIVRSDGSEIDTTNESGDYILPLTPGTGRYVYSELEGLFARPEPVGAFPGYLFPIADTSYIDLIFEPPSIGLDEIDAYYHVNVVHNWVNTVDPEFTGMDYQVMCYVRETDPPCPNNAFWDGSSIHMGAGGVDGYDNWSYYCDVFYHEYGHGITHFQYPSGYLPYTGESGAIDEACSDYTACTITDEPDIGEGGLSPYGMLRSMDNDLIYPDDIADEVHADGRIIGGAFWDLRTLLGASYTDTLIHFAKYGYPEEFQAYLEEVLLVDDDDGNILNGTPNFMTIYEAFQGHGIGNFEVTIVHDPLRDTEDCTGPYYVSCFVGSTLPPDPSAVELYYSSDGGSSWSSSIMSETTIDREFEAEIPGMVMSTEVHYYLSACDTMGICATLPDSAPDESFSFYVGTDTIAPKIFHKPLTPVAVEAAPYDLKFKVTDNLGVGDVNVYWKLNDGIAESLSVEPDSAGNYLTSLDPTSPVVGDSIGYKIVALDAAASPNTAYMPDSGYHWFDMVRAIWFDFEDDDGAFVSSDGWEWGEGDVEAHSGTKMWGTSLFSNYSNNAVYELTTETYNISDWDCATLELWANFNSEWLYDGGNVWVSNDDGMRWYLLKPIGGYPSSYVEALLEPGFTGFSDGWKKYEFDLRPYVEGSTGYIAFKFIFKSDDGGTAPGLFIDDIAILERQIILPPGNLTALSGYDNRVPLHWGEPDPEATEGERSRPMALEGYNIYRSEISGEYIGGPINSSPVPETTYIDTSVTNETTYYYRVTAVYGDKESSPNMEASAVPFNARASITPDSIYIRVTQSPEVFDTTITISNIGDGGLSFQITEYTFRPDFSRRRPVRMDEFDLMGLLNRMAEDGVFDSIDYSYSMIPPEPDNWRHIYHDPNEILVTKDIKDVYGQHDVGNVWFKFDSYSYMGDPEEDYAAGFAFDIDLDETTGSPDLPGVEYLAATGALPLPGDGIILRYDPESSYGWNLGGMPNWVIKSGDSIGIGFAKSAIGSPPSAYITAAVMSEMSGVPIPDDLAPNLGGEPVVFSMMDAWWISETPITGEVTGGTTQDIDLRVEVPSLPPGEYYVWLHIQTNDRTEPNKIVPVVCKIDAIGVKDESKPVEFAIEEPYPNPFNANCRIKFSVPGGEMNIYLYDISGRKVGTLYQGTLPEGYYTMDLNGDNPNSRLSSGVYLLKMQYENQVETRKIMLIK